MSLFTFSRYALPEASLPIWQTFAVWLSSPRGIGRKRAYVFNTDGSVPLKRAAYFLAFLAVTGCAQLPAGNAVQAEKPAASSDIISFDIPADALGARDPQLNAVLSKAGALAAAQKQPTTIRVTALAQDLPYINQAIWKGVGASRPLKLITLENLTAGANQPYSVSIKPTQSGG